MQSNLSLVTQQVSDLAGREEEWGRGKLSCSWAELGLRRENLRKRGSAATLSPNRLELGDWPGLGIPHTPSEEQPWTRVNSEASGMEMGLIQRVWDLWGWYASVAANVFDICLGLPARQRPRHFELSHILGPLPSPGHSHTPSGRCLGSRVRACLNYCVCSDWQVFRKCLLNE